jgi:DNA polymerase III gamma/tau subunit
LVGQESLVKIFEGHIAENSIPRTVLLSGEWGSGKHTFVKEFAAKIGYDIIDITDCISLEKIQEAQLSPYPNIYIINCDEISVKEQNMLLKFLEEPLKNAYIFLLSSCKQKLLPTVVNRCRVYSFSNYNSEELKQFLHKDCDFSDIVLQYATTPGWVLKLQESGLQDIINLCEKIFKKITVANYSNALTIPDKISLTKTDTDKMDFSTFCYVLINMSKDLYCKGIISFEMFNLTREFYNNTFIPNVNKRHLVENYIVNLKQEAESGAK